jgi:heterodisulfide reductase subunit A-like polyferredoxin
MQAQRNGTPMLASSGYLCQVDEERCVGCGACAAICPFEAVAVRDGRAVVDQATCMGCGVCVAHCPHEALALERDPTKGMPLEMDELLAAR